MAITFDAKSTNLITTGTAISFTHTPVGVPTLVTVIFAMRDDVTFISGTPTYGGSNMTQSQRQSDATNSLGLEIWYLADPPADAQTVAAAIDDSGIDTRTIVATWLGTTTTTPLDQFTGANGAATVNITPTEDGEVVIGGIISEDSNAPTTGAGETELYATDEGTWATGASYAIQTTAATQTVDWTSGDGTESAVIVSSFKVAGGAPAAAPPKRLTMLNVG